MKKFLIIFLVLAILFIPSLIAVNIIAARADDSVVYRESTIIGDPREADGITVDLNLQLMEHLFWDVNLTLGAEIEENTDFDFDYDPPRYQASLKPTFDIGFGITSFGGSSSGNMLDGQDRFFGLYDVIADVASRTPDGEKHTENVRLSDYFDYYPINVDINIGDLGYSTYSPHYDSDTKYNSLMRRIDEYFADNFRFAIPDNAVHTVTVSKRIDGTVESVSVNPSDNTPWYYLDSRSIVTDDAIYFICTPCAEEDPSYIYETDTEYGIYRIPYEITEYTPPQKYSSNEYTDIKIDKAELVCPISDGYKIVAMSMSADGSEIYLTSRKKSAEKSEIRLTVFDCESMSVKQQTTLFECGTDENVQLVHTDDSFMVYKINWLTFAVIENSSGEWKTDFTVTDQTITDFWSSQTYITSSYGYGFDYDGERLAVMGCSNTYGNYRSDIAESYLSSFFISVYSEKGNLYTGKFTSSLDTGTHLRYNYLSKPTDRYEPSIKLP